MVSEFIDGLRNTALSAAFPGFGCFARTAGRAKHPWHHVPTFAAATDRIARKWEFGFTSTSATARLMPRKLWLFN